MGGTFDLEGDYLLKKSDELNFCQTFIFIDLRMFYPPKSIGDFYNVFKALEKEQKQSCWFDFKE